MDLIREVVSTTYAFPAGIVVLVISCAILVFVFGFKSAEEPSFDELSFSNEDRKPAGKKRKLKDKKSQSNGHVVSLKEKSSKTSSDEGAKASKQSPKEPPKEIAKKKDQPKEKKQDVSSSAKKASSAVPKASKKSGKDAEAAVKNDEKQEKIDDDDGWEQVGKKNRKGSPNASEEKSPVSPSKEKKVKKMALEKTSEVKAASPTSMESTQENIVEAPKEEDPILIVVKETPKSPGKKKEEVKKVQEDVKIKNVQEDVKPEPKTDEKKDKKSKKAPPVDSSNIIPPPPKATDDAEVPSDNKVDGAVFDELGDVWTEKVPKKSKKKVRKE